MQTNFEWSIIKGAEEGNKSKQWDSSSTKIVYEQIQIHATEWLNERDTLKFHLQTCLPNKLQNIEGHHDMNYTQTELKT